MSYDGSVRYEFADAVIVRDPVFSGWHAATVIATQDITDEEAELKQSLWPGMQGGDQRVTVQIDVDKPGAVGKKFSFFAGETDSIMPALKARTSQPSDGDGKSVPERDFPLN